MSEPIRYRIYPSWMWIVITIFLGVSLFLLSRDWPSVIPPRKIDFWVALTPFLAVTCYLPRLHWTRNGGTYFTSLFYLCLSIFLSMTLLPYIEASRSQVLLELRHNQFKTIGVALRSYHEKYGSFPPAKYLDPDRGTEEDWQTILMANPSDELSPSDFRAWGSSTDETETSNQFFAVVGKNTAWPSDGRKASLEDIVDPANTAILVSILDPPPSFAQKTTISLDDLTSGNLSWEEAIATDFYQKDGFSPAQPSKLLLMADGTLRHHIGIPRPDEIRCLFDIHSPESVLRPIASSDSQASYFQSASTESVQIPFLRIFYHVWQICLFFMFFAIFLPRQPIIEG